MQGWVSRRLVAVWCAWYDPADGQPPVVNSQRVDGDVADADDMTTAAVVSGDGRLIQNGAGNDATNTGARPPRTLLTDASA